MTTYIQALRRQSAEIRTRNAEARALQSRSLDEKIKTWYAELPPQQRRTHYSMADFVLLFGAAPGLIGNSLHRVGWERRRRFSGPGSYCRYWVPAHVELH